MRRDVIKNAVSGPSEKRVDPLAFRLCSWGFRPREALEALGPVLDAPGELLALFPGAGAADA